MGALQSTTLLAISFHCNAQSLVNYTDFATFPISLPTALRQHIAAVYNDKLFIIGGANDTVFNADQLSYKAWSLDLSSVNLQLSSTKDDIDLTALNSNVQWQELNIANPAYGTSANGAIRCAAQCYTQIGQYLYIAAPYSIADTSFSQYMYRLDLSQSPPVYATSADLGAGETLAFSTIQGALKEPCLTSSADGQFLYVVGGDLSSGAGAKVLLQFDVSSMQWTKLTNMYRDRQSAGCAVNYNGEEVSIFGGWNSAVGVTETIDTYSVDTQTWTNNQGYASRAQLTNPVRDVKCVSNPYDETIICPGGYGAVAYQDTSVYRTPQKKIIDTIQLVNDTAAYGLATYEFVNNGVDQASILFVTGGGDWSFNVYDTIQYTVIVNVATDSPTTAPTVSPSMSPTTAPSESPTAAPSQAPIQPPTAAPTEGPTTPATTMQETRDGIAPPKETDPFLTDPGAAFAIDLTLNLFIVLCSVIIVLF